MRTKTGILWTTIAIGFLLQYTEVLVLADSETGTTASKSPASLTASTAAPIPAESTVANTTPAKQTTIAPAPTPAQPIIVKTNPANPTTAESVSTKAPPADPTPKITASATPAGSESTIANSTIANPAHTEPTHAKTTTEKPATEKPATEKPVTKKSVTEKSVTEKSATEKTSQAQPTLSNPTKSSPEKHSPAESTSPKPTTVNPAGADLAPAAAAATSGPTSDVSTPHYSVTAAADQASTSRPQRPTDPLTVTSKPSPASTQPGPALTSQDQFNTTNGPARTTVSQPETTQPIIKASFSEKISSNDFQDPFKKESTNVQVCEKLLKKLSAAGSCVLTGEKVNNVYKFTSVSVAVDPFRAQEIYDEISTHTPVPHTLIAILSSCGALMLILICFALYCMYHHRSYRKNQQHLTEELQTVENGYHDNPTLEVMEVQPEMQEKKLALNGEFNDSWIVPFDNLAKEETPDEEDTHL